MQQRQKRQQPELATPQSIMCTRLADQPHEATHELCMIRYNSPPRDKRDTPGESSSQFRKSPARIPERPRPTCCRRSRCCTFHRRRHQWRWCIRHCHSEGQCSIAGHWRRRRRTRRPYIRRSRGSQCSLVLAADGRRHRHHQHRWTLVMSVMSAFPPHPNFHFQ